MLYDSFHRQMIGTRDHGGPFELRARATGNLSRANRPGFKLLEVVIVLVALVIVAAVGIVLLIRNRATAARTECVNNLRQLGQAVQLCNESNKVLPPLSAKTYIAPITVEGPYKDVVGGTVLFFLLPFVGEEPLYRAAAGNINTLVEGVAVYAKPVRMFRCPDDPSPSGATGFGPDHGLANGWAISNYGANYLVFGDPGAGSTEGAASLGKTFPKNSLTKTVLFGERYGSCGSPPYGSLWGDANAVFRPQICNPSPSQDQPKAGYLPCSMFQVAPKWDKECEIAYAQTPHPKGMNVGLADGSVRAVTNKISPVTWARACDPRDGDQPGQDW